MESFANDDIDLRRVDRAPTYMPLLQGESRQAQTGQSFHQLRKRHPEVNESPEYHVPTDTRETVEMKMRSH